MVRRLGVVIAAWLACVTIAEAPDDVVHIEAHEYKFSSHHRATPSHDGEIKIYSTDISGNELRERARGEVSNAARDIAPVPFVPVMPTNLDVVDIPDAIVLSPDQIRDVSIIVQALLLAGVIAASLVSRIVSVVRARRAVDDAIERVHRLVDPAAICKALHESTNADFHAAATLRLRVLTFLTEVNDVVAESYHKEFDHARWVVVNRATKKDEPTNVEALLERLTAAVSEGDALVSILATQDAPSLRAVQRAIETHVETLAVRLDQIKQLKETILDKVHAAIGASKQRNGVSLDEWKRLKDLWLSLGLSESHVTEPDGWYQTALRNLERQESMLVELHTLKGHAEVSMVVASPAQPIETGVLDRMTALLKQAKREEWAHDDFYQLEVFVQAKTDELARQPMMLAPPFAGAMALPSLGHDVDALGNARRGRDRGGDQERGMDLQDVLQLQMVQKKALQDEALVFQKLNTDRIMLHERKMHLELLDQRQRQFELTVQAKRERDEAKYQRQLQDATDKLERKVAAKKQKQADKDAKAAAAAQAKLVQLRVQDEWRLVKHVLGLNALVVIMVLALVFWDAVTSRDWISSTCDVRQSYWTPTHLSVLGCKAMYGAQVAMVMVAGLLFLSVFSYLNLSLWGVSILGGFALYTFRASWQHVMSRSPRLLWLVGFNYCVGHLLALDRRNHWMCCIDWRPVVVYIAYPAVSLGVALVVGTSIACDAPIECFHAAVSWCSTHASDLAAMAMTAGLITAQTDDGTP